MKRYGFFSIVLMSCVPLSEPDSHPMDCETVVNWNNFGQGFVVENCQSCHASTSLNRNNAPESVIFDSEADVATNLDAIFETVLSDSPSMPPEGGLTGDDLQLVETWLTCFPPE